MLNATKRAQKSDNKYSYRNNNNVFMFVYCRKEIWDNIHIEITGSVFKEKKIGYLNLLKKNKLHCTFL